MPPTYRLPRIGGAVALLAVTSLIAPPARADFLDDVRKTFTKDMPHFFQDDIPCAFGGQPTSHTRRSCKDKSENTPPVRRNRDRTQDR
jgi:hypothetical protein